MTRLFSALLLFAITATPALAADPKFRRPLETLLSPVYSAHYDHDTAAAAKNYSCGGTTVYNGHKGTDFRAALGTSVYAAAAGGLYYRYNDCPTYGSFGSTCGGGYGNHVRIDHEGVLTDGAGWSTIYAHLQQWTASYPSSVLCGSPVGKTGSSGNSTGPHLHFEVRKYAYPNSDPFAGACSQPTSFWVNQNGGVPMAQCQ